MSSLMRARSMSDLICVVPALLGFHPEHSLVAVATHGPNRRLGFRLRLDLPPSRHREAAADEVVEHLKRQDPDGVLLVAFARDPHSADPFVDAVRSRLVVAGVEVVEAARSDGRRYWSYTCDDPGCCPPEGVPHDASSSAMLAEAVYHGLEVLPDRDAVVARFAPAAGRERERAEAIGTVVDDLVAAAGGHLADDLPQRDADLVRAGLDVVVPLLDAVDAGRDAALLTDRQAASLAVWTSLVVVRDVAWARITPENAEAALALWREVGVRSVAPFVAAPMALAGFAAWLSGRGSLAQCALDRALGAEPDYSMARHLQAAVGGCLDPRSWEGVSVDEVMRSVPGLA